MAEPKMANALIRLEIRMVAVVGHWLWTDVGEKELRVRFCVSLPRYVRGDLAVFDGPSLW